MIFSFVKLHTERRGNRDIILSQRPPSAAKAAGTFFLYWAKLTTRGTLESREGSRGRESREGEQGRESREGSRGRESREEEQGRESREGEQGRESREGSRGGRVGEGE